MDHIPVLIAGGGPAGAATALSLAARKIPCIIAEASPSPQDKAGETIPANAAPLLHKLGIMGLLEEPAHLPCYGNRFIWGREQPADKLYFFHIHQQGWHLDRRIFEQQLQAKVTVTDTRYLNGWRVTQCNPDDGQWTVSLKNDNNNTRMISCDFIADATGKSCRIARMLGSTRHHADKLVGVSTSYQLTGVLPQYTFIEAVQNGWWYAALLSGQRLMTTFMTDADLLRPEVRHPQGYLDSLRQTGLIAPLLSNVNVYTESEPSVFTAASGYLSACYGQRWLAVGDAAFSYDPISSYGITSALEGGFYAGHAIADTLAGNRDALPAYDWLITQAFTRYTTMHQHQYQQEQRWAQQPFWQRRHSLIPA